MEVKKINENTYEVILVPEELEQMEKVREFRGMKSIEGVIEASLEIEMEAIY